jgi:hypothetical protein
VIDGVSVMLPLSWKSEIQETVEKATNADREQREAQANNATSNVAAAIQSIRDAQNTQTSHEDRYQK